MTEYKTRVAIVTGGARGIGRGCALELAQRGFDIALVDLLVPEMERTAGEIRERGRHALTFEADVSRFDRAQEIAGEVKKSWGQINFLLNNAGRSMSKGLLEITEEEWDRTIDVNLKSCFNWCKAVAPIMIAQGGGRIASMSSLNAHWWGHQCRQQVCLRGGQGRYSGIDPGACQGTWPDNHDQRNLPGRDRD
jgi:3-oxoacyl-[acyl-carrier protein] reductase